MHEKAVYRSKIAIAILVAVVLVCGLIVLLAGSAAVVGIVASIGVLVVLLTGRSGIEVTDDGFKVRGLLRTRNLEWSQTDAFIVVGYSGEVGYFGTGTVNADPYHSGAVTSGTNMTPSAVTSFAVANREHMLSLVAVVTDHGQRIKVPGTASSFLDRRFPAQAAAELNRTLKTHNPTATAS